VSQSVDFTVPVRPQKNGDKVRCLLTDDARQAYDHGYDCIAENFKGLRTTTVAMVLPFSRQLYPAQEALEQRGLSVKRTKGAGLGSFDGGVVVTTYHQLKGLEFDHVVIMGLHDAQYPGRLLESSPEEEQLEEANLQRRVLYVAMTRARQIVTLVGSRPFCRFFEEVPEELFESIK